MITLICMDDLVKSALQVNGLLDYRFHSTEPLMVFAARITKTDNETYRLVTRPVISDTDKPFFEYLHGQVQMLLLHLFPPLDHFENSNCSA